MTIIGAILAYLFLDGTARVLVIAGLLFSDVIEIAIWLRWRKRRSSTGAEGMLGRTGIAITDCAPEGKVRVMDQIWNASSNDPLVAGEEVEVIDTEGLRLHVARR